MGGSAVKRECSRGKDRLVGVEGFLSGYMEFDMPVGPPVKNSGQRAGPRARCRGHAFRVTVEGE